MWYNITVIMHGCKLNVNMETMKCMAVNINIGIQFMGTMHGSRKKGTLYILLKVWPIDFSLYSPSSWEWIKVESHKLV